MHTYIFLQHMYDYTNTFKHIYNHTHIHTRLLLSALPEKTQPSVMNALLYRWPRPAASACRGVSTPGARTHPRFTLCYYSLYLHVNIPQFTPCLVLIYYRFTRFSDFSRAMLCSCDHALFPRVLNTFFSISLFY